MAQSSESARLELQRQAGAAVTLAWNGENGAVHTLDLFPVMDWEDQKNKQITKHKFNAMYQALEDIDAPEGQVRPIAKTTRAQSFAQPLNAILPEENLEINYQKRALSFFHGAILAIQYQPGLTEEERTGLSNKIIAVYNRFKDGPRYNQFLEQRYEIHWGRKQAYYLKKMLIRMTLELENYGMGYGDIKAGEMVANLERERPKVIESKLTSSFDQTLTCDVQIQETPLNSTLSDPIYNEQYQFLDDPTVQRPDWFLELKPVVQCYLIENRHNPNLPAIPATLRGIPGLANMNIHEGIFKSDRTEPDLNVNNKVFRHGTLTPYSMDNNNERRNATYANGSALAKVLVPAAMQNFNDFWAKNAAPSFAIPLADLSFMSPLEKEEAIVNYAANRKSKKSSESVFDERPSFKLFGLFDVTKIFHESNRAMKLENQAGYEHGIRAHENARSFKLFATNLGINGDRWEAGDTFAAPDYRATVSAAVAYFDDVNIFVQNQDSTPFSNLQNKNKFTMAQLAVDQLAKSNNNMMRTFKTPFNEASDSLKNLSRRINPELFANCLYAIIIEGMGGTVSACCKSTKDRTGLFILHLDAMHQYYAETGNLPTYNDAENSPDRKRFVNIMANLYLANTQQYAASQATFGAGGIKKPGGALGNMGAIPTDLLAALEVKSPGIFAKQKQLADINKIKFDVKWNKLHKINHVGAWSQKKYETALFTWESLSWDSFTNAINNTIDRFKSMFGIGISKEQVKKLGYMEIN